MWRKPTEGKLSSDVPQPPASAPAATTKPPVSSQPPAITAPATPAPLSEQPQALPGTSRIHSGLRIHGEISGSSDLYIDGEMQGKIRLGSARVVVGPNGNVQADIEARGIVIDGSVQGNLKAGESVHLGKTGRLQGSVVTPRIGIDDGARLRGKVEMTRGGSSAPPAARTTDSDSEALRPVTVNAKDDE
ncbi:MAG: polymer-forming cytoskeletal protein [Candidatus Acidiferrales bacterium]